MNNIMWESLQGSFTLNDEKLEGQLLKVISAYIMEDNLLYPHAHRGRDHDVLRGVLTIPFVVHLEEEGSSISTHQLAQPPVCC